MTDPICDALLPGVSRTFAIPIQALPHQLRAAVQTAYLLCRIVDCIEDEPALDPVLRSRWFDAFDHAMEHDRGALRELAASHRLGATRAELDLCRQAERVFDDFDRLGPAQRDAITAPVLEMSSGMRQFSARVDQTGTLRLTDIAELERYCYFVAGTVGLLLDGLFCLETDSPLLTEPRKELAVHFGVGLQLVNILKDLAEDAERHVCYLPTSLLQTHGLEADTLLQPANREAGLAAIRDLAGLARERLHAAARYVRAWPGPDARSIRSFCLLPMVLAVQTLDQLESGRDVLVPGRTPKISRRRVRALVTAVRVSRGERRMRALLGSVGL